MLSAFLFTAPALAAGETINYPGQVLAPGPWGTSGSLFSSTSWNDNTVNISGGPTITGHVYGGARSSAGSVTGNSVLFDSGRVSNNVYGGRSDTLAGDTLNNTVKLSGTALVDKVVYGGYNAKGNANFNIVDLSGTAKVTGDVNGGWSNSGGTANNNHVTISDNAIAGAVVYGGKNAQGNANNNTVTLSGNASVTDAIFGGWSDTLDGGVSYNEVFINGGTAKDNVYGGRNVKGQVSYNTVTMTAGTVNFNVHGGMSGADDGTATHNTVNIFGGTVGGATSDPAHGNVYGGKNLLGDASYNRVNISGSTSLIKQDVYGGWSDASLGAANFNNVNMSDGAVNFNIYGGHNLLGDASDNVVSISGGLVGATAGNGNVYGGYSDNAVGIANRNTVILTGGTINQSVYGGHNLLGDASYNSVILSGGSVAADVYGGWSADGNARNNSLTLSGTPVLTTAALYGNNNPNGGTSWQTDGNTLNVYDSGHSVSNVANFQNYNFFLPPSYAAGITMLTVTNNITDTDISGSTVKINFTGAGSPLAAGDRLTFLKTTGANLVGTPASYTSSITQGVSLQYSLTFLKDINSLYAIVNGVTVHPQTKALSEGTVAGLAFLNQGTDLASGKGMDAAVSVLGHREEIGRAAVFGVISGGTSRYHTGSHVDVNGFSLISGVAWGTDLSSGKLVFGPFFETGRGNYNSYNSFTNAPSVTGNGNTEYYGGGILGRYNLTEGALKGLYTEASLRAGHTSTDFSSNDLWDIGTGQNASYDSGAAYYGAHAGLGYIWQLNEAASLDISTKYLWMHQNSDSVTVAGDPITFKAANSQRWRNGARFNYALSTASGPQITSYIGAAYEYEFDGKTQATAYGLDIEAPSLKGGTGLGEIGLNLKPVKDSLFSADLGLQGYTGKREGVTGSLQLKFEF